MVRGDGLRWLLLSVSPDAPRARRVAGPRVRRRGVDGSFPERSVVGWSVVGRWLGQQHAVEHVDDAVVGLDVGGDHGGWADAEGIAGVDRP